MKLRRSRPRARARPRRCAGIRSSPSPSPTDSTTGPRNASRWSPALSSRFRWEVFMANLEVVAAQRAAALTTLYDWRDHHPLTLQRPVYFVPGFTDELGRSAWGMGEPAGSFSFALVVPHVITNHDTHAHFVSFHADGGNGPPPYENF